jgi:hypothetical protein
MRIKFALGLFSIGFVSKTNWIYPIRIDPFDPLANTTKNEYKNILNRPYINGSAI